jgi:hypothetical protein
MVTEVDTRFQRPEFDHIWEVYKHVAKFEHHFNTLQSTYRTLASTWLLAMFVGIGYVMANKFDWGINRLLLGTTRTSGLIKPKEIRISRHCSIPMDTKPDEPLVLFPCGVGLDRSAPIVALRAFAFRRKATNA